MTNQLIQKTKLERWLRNTIHIVTRNHRFQVTVSIILALLLGAEIYYYRMQLKDLIRWPTLGIILVIALLAILWFRVPEFKKIIGEGKSVKKRSRFQWFAYTGLLIVFLLPISIYYIDSLAIQRPQALEQLSFIAVGLAFSGISFGAASIPGMTPESRIGLVSVAQKFVLVTILFIFFVPLINIFNFPPFKNVDVNSLDLGDPNAWLRGITFYLMSLCFYGGQLLFLFGITDLVRSFVDLDIIRDRKQGVNSNVSHDPTTITRIPPDRQELIENLESFDFITFPATARYYESKGLGDISRRINFIHTPGYAAPKMLKNAFLDMYEGKAAPFLDFYERAFYGKDPHYEDAIAIATLILTGIGAIASPFLAALYSENLRRRAEKAREEVSLLDQREILDLLDYLLKAYALREAWKNNEIDFELFTRGRQSMRLRLSRIRANKKTQLLTSRDKLPQGGSDRLAEITSKWLEKHQIDVSETLISELVKELEAELRRRQPIPLEIPDETKNWRVIRGSGASPGKAFGRAINIMSEHPNTTSLGDVGIFDSWEPEMVEIVKKCVASIGTRGGRTSHLAIVSRAIGIPSVVGVGDILVKDGVRVLVNGDDGTVLVEPLKLV